MSKKKNNAKESIPGIVDELKKLNTKMGNIEKNMRKDNLDRLFGKLEFPATFFLGILTLWILYNQNAILQYEKTPIVDVAYSSCPLSFTGYYVLDDITLLPRGVRTTHKVKIESNELNKACVNIFGSPINTTPPVGCEYDKAETFWFSAADNQINYYFIISPKNWGDYLQYNISYEYHDRIQFGDNSSIGKAYRTCEYKSTNGTYILKNQSGWVFG
ncbi:hypothetical protein HY988_00835 [Candidatus Micrarchaeota archaeon]|nr:hypothetical protein [Candidatus Micrarchaeota archaeon]